MAFGRKPMRVRSSAIIAAVMRKSKCPLADSGGRFALALALAPLLAACGRQQPQPQARFSEDQSATEFALNPKPDSSEAAWTVAADGKGIDFGKPTTAPLLSLTCQIGNGNASPQLTVIRHARSEPGAKALFAVLGNGIISRLKVDAALDDKEGWRWEGRYPASAPELDVFTGQRDIDATLPGGGELHVTGSGLPREFVDWCRRNGVERNATSPAPG